MSIRSLALGRSLLALLPCAALAATSLGSAAQGTIASRTRSSTAGGKWSTTLPPNWARRRWVFLLE